MLNTGVFEGILEIEGMSSSSRSDTVACSTRFSADVLRQSQTYITSHVIWNNVKNKNITEET